MKIKDGFILQKVGSGYLAVAVGDRADTCKAMIRLNETGAFLWNLFSDTERTKDEAVALFMKEYEIDEALAQRDLTAFVMKLSEAGLLDE